jgi:hypothetical protein
MGTLNGYVRLYRKLVEWGWYRDSVVKDVFLHLLMIANWKDGAYMGHAIHPGDAIIGTKQLAVDLGFSRQQIRTALKKLESTGEISIFSTNRFSIVTVENWGLYQGDDSDANQQITNKQPTDNQQITNKQPHLKKERKKEGKKENNNTPLTPLGECPPELVQPMMDFIEHRKSMRKPMSELAVTRMLSRLNKLSGGDIEMCKEMIDTSIANGWQGIFPPDEKRTRQQRPRNEVLEMLRRGEFDD